MCVQKEMAIIAVSAPRNLVLMNCCLFQKLPIPSRRSSKLNFRSKGFTPFARYAQSQQDLFSSRLQGWLLSPQWSHNEIRNLPVYVYLYIPPVYKVSMNLLSLLLVLAVIILRYWKLIYVILSDGIENLPKLVEDIVQTSINTGPRGALRLAQGIQAFLGVGGEWLADASKVVCASVVFFRFYFDTNK